MDNIKDIINTVVGKISKQTPSDVELENIFKEVFTKNEKKHLKFIGVSNNVILIHTDSAAVNYQMKMKKGAILKGFKNKMDDVRDISFKIGSIL